ESAVRKTFDRHFHEAGVEPDIVCESLFCAGLCKLVQQGLGLGIIDLFTAFDFAEAGLVFRRFEPEVVFHVAILHPRHLALRTPVQ
ncbi:MAG: LysR substrate-binding domain-containing protein, partial [Alphaproteobacteria bacterium]|nr:LysR substrate-binding domain-containing protein [Alphaproteobacteria bacterium]